MMKFKGVNVSPGVEIGKAYILDDYGYVPVRKYSISDDEAEEEIKLFQKAVGEASEDIRGLHKKIAEDLGEEQAGIIEAQLFFLEDKYLVENTKKRIKERKMNAAYVFSRVLDETMEVFSKLDNHYFRGRVEDLKYIGRMVLRRMSGIEDVAISEIKDRVIVIGHELSPADTAMMKKENVIAFATDMGSRSSHTAIMARSIGIPAVVGLGNITQSVKAGDTVVIDGNSGEVYVNPEEEIIERFKEKRRVHLETERSLGEFFKLPAQTIDGHRVSLMANIELPSEMDSVISHGADGIGLYRTEFLYLNRKDFPDEEEQYEAYSSVISRSAPGRVVIRTVDLGGDKFASEMEMPGEMNPFLGWRGIRFSLEQPEIFKVQLRAILRAAREGKAGIMFPLVSCLEEFLQAKKYLEEAKAGLKKDGLSFSDDLKVGVMIETPSSAMIADILAVESDFFSIGTNDLIQYAMAVDRINEKIAYLYRPAHPGILRMIKNVIDAGHANNSDVYMCGEMAGESSFLVVLVGMGIDGLSMSPVGIPPAKKIIRSTTYDRAKQLAERVLEMSTAEEVERAIGSIKTGV